MSVDEGDEDLKLLREKPVVNQWPADHAEYVTEKHPGYVSTCSF